MLESIRGHRLIQRTVDLHDGASSVSPAGPADGPDFDGRIFRSVYGPRWRLLIIGANQTAQVLASVAATLISTSRYATRARSSTATGTVPGDPAHQHAR